MINIIFPFKLQLFIFQLEDYQIPRFLPWIFKNFFKRKLQGKESLVLTTKAKLIYYLAILLAILLIFILSFILNFWGFLLGLFLSTQTYLFLVISLLLIKPLEIILVSKIKNKTKNKITKLKKTGLKVIGITGSYGKTSTKEILYQILKTRYKVLRTPESYNTLLGIAKVIDLELDENYDFFICEMGAYKTGEIKEICDVVLPDYGILTSIGEMHLERFGTLENIIKAKFELVQAVDTAILNQDNINIFNNYKKYTDKPVFYSLTNKNIQTNLLGKNNLSNITTAATMAKTLGMPSDLITKSIKNLKSVSRRLEVKKISDKLTYIDDSYNTNVSGLEDALEILNSFKNQTKIIVTPGIVELGHKNNEVHQALGKKIDQSCDYIILLGKTFRTLAIKKGVVNQNKIIFINSIDELDQTLKKIKYKKAVVLLKNDLPENY
jgi:UDP-N-acetylmuramoyl-tripeptide--D-alanyl-D-alanine ligase